jgi:hypothetical protein
VAVGVHRARRESVPGLGRVRIERQPVGVHPERRCRHSPLAFSAWSRRG